MLYLIPREPLSTKLHTDLHIQGAASCTKRDIGLIQLFFLWDILRLIAPSHDVSCEISWDTPKEATCQDKNLLVKLITIYLHHSLDLSDQCIGIKGTTDVTLATHFKRGAIASTPANRIDL